MGQKKQVAQWNVQLNIFFTQFQGCKIMQYIVYGYIDR